MIFLFPRWDVLIPWRVVFFLNFPLTLLVAEIWKSLLEVVWFLPRWDWYIPAFRVGFWSNQQHQSGMNPRVNLLLVEHFSFIHLGVSKNRGTPKWIVYNGKPYWNGWFGVPLFSETSISFPAFSYLRLQHHWRLSKMHFSSPLQTEDSINLSESIQRFFWKAACNGSCGILQKIVGKHLSWLWDTFFL